MSVVIGTDGTIWEADDGNYGTVWINPDLSSMRDMNTIDESGVRWALFAMIIGDKFEIFFNSEDCKSSDPEYTFNTQHEADLKYWHIVNNAKEEMVRQLL